MADIRAHLRIYGVVQGVAFRYSTRREAMRLKLTGWVRNLPDGSVEAVVEGDEARVERLITWCGHGPPGGKVDRVKVERSDSTGAFSRFEITY